MIIWLLFIFVTSVSEAYLFHKTPFVTISIPYIHYLFTLIRGVVWIGVALLCGLGWYYVIPSCLIFPYLHDGMYYYTRNKLNPRIYRLGWKARSLETNAVLSFKFETRYYLFMLGVAVYVWIKILELKQN
jgi:hypothetical protein